MNSATSQRASSTSQRASVRGGGRRAPHSCGLRHRLGRGRPSCQRSNEQETKKKGPRCIACLVTQHEACIPTGVHTHRFPPSGGGARGARVRQPRGGNRKRTRVRPARSQTTAQRRPQARLPLREDTCTQLPPPRRSAARPPGTRPTHFRAACLSSSNASVQKRSRMLDLPTPLSPMSSSLKRWSKFSAMAPQTRTRATQRRAARAACIWRQGLYYTGFYNETQKLRPGFNACVR